MLMAAWLRGVKPVLRDCRVKPGQLQIAYWLLQRRRQCEASSRPAALAPEIRRESNFLLRSGVVRTAVAAALERLGESPGATVKTRPLHWVRSDSYA